MKFVLILGPQAVGKMSIGEKLADKTGLKLFHNHMTIDLLLKLFTWDEMGTLSKDFREAIFKRFVSLKDKEGLIFTYVMDFDDPHEWQYIEDIQSIFKDDDVYIIELYADLNTRLERNKTPNRLAKKWTKRDIEANEERMKATMMKHRTTSYDGEVISDNYLKIDTTNVPIEDAASRIVTFIDERGNKGGKR